MQPVAVAAPVAQTPWWWCVDGKLPNCYSSRENCGQITNLWNTYNANDPMSCGVRATAWCKQTCGSAPMPPVCTWQCGADADTCEKLPLGTNQQLEVACRERTPPKNPVAFPGHFEPGWWCSDVPRDDGSIYSSCVKPRRECEGLLDIMLAQSGVTRTTVPGIEGRIECKPASRAWCSTAKIHMELGDVTRFNCSRTAAQCDELLSALKAKSADGKMTVGNFKLDLSDRCEEWTYD